MGKHVSEQGFCSMFGCSPLPHLNQKYTQNELFLIKNQQMVKLDVVCYPVEERESGKTEFIILPQL